MVKGNFKGFGLLVLSFVFLLSLTMSASAFSGSGTGISGDPFQITNCTQLQEMSGATSSYYVLMNDVDCSDTVNWNAGAGFVPVGFTGNFNGQGNFISDLFIVKTSGNTGLFSSFSGTIINTGLVNVNITGGSATGVFSGSSSGGLIRNCSASGRIESLGLGVGGFIGNPTSTTVVDSFANVTLVITSGYSPYRWGGLFGTTSNVVVNNSYSSSYVPFTPYTGGIIGRDVGGTVLTDTFYDSTLTSSNNIDSDGIPKTTAQMKTQSTFTNWDFTNIWIMNAGEYPSLRVFSACVSDWVCSGYASCDMNDEEVCNAVTDLNSCGVSYSGDFSEFSPLVCDFCTPVWQCSGYGVCQPDDFVYCSGVNDTQVCGEVYGGDMSEFTQSCTYCSESWVGSFGLCRNGVHVWSYVDVNNCGTVDDLPVVPLNGSVSSCVEVAEGGGGATPIPVLEASKPVVVLQTAISGNGGASTSAFVQFWSKFWNWLIFWN